MPSLYLSSKEKYLDGAGSRIINQRRSHRPLLDSTAYANEETFSLLVPDSEGELFQAIKKSVNLSISEGRARGC